MATFHQSYPQPATTVGRNKTRIDVHISRYPGKSGEKLGRAGVRVGVNASCSYSCEKNKRKLCFFNGYS